MVDQVKQVVIDRIQGERPSAPRAFFAAVAVGVAVAVITYRALRA